MIKRVILLALLITLSTFSGFAQPNQPNAARKHAAFIDSLMATVDIGRQNISTGILYDRAVPIAGLQGFRQDRSVSRGRFMQAALELRNAAYDTLPYRSTEDLRKIADYYTYRQNFVPLGILYSRFTHIDTLAVEKGYIIIDGQVRPRPTGRLKFEGLRERNVLMAAILSDQQEVEANVRFVLPPELMVGNRAGAVVQLEANFGDGLGFRTISPSVPVEVSYPTSGEKTLTVRATDSGGFIISAITSIEVKSSEPINWGLYGTNALRQQPIYAQIFYNDGERNYPGLGHVTYLYRNPDKKLRKPVLVVDGFDPLNKRPDDVIFFDYLNKEEGIKFANMLYEDGYDLVILDFPNVPNQYTQCFYPIDDSGIAGYFDYCIIDGGADYIQRNAFVAVKVIQELNGQLAANGSNEQLVIIGGCMGALITRYALSYMEQNGLSHNTRLWVSLDSPHNGANVPIGAQHFINYFSSLSDEAGVGLYKVNTPAAKQLVLHHYSSNSEAVAGSSLRGSWVSTLNTIGFPQQLRRVAVTNGSLNSTPTATTCSRAVTMNIKSLFTTVGWGYVNTTAGYGQRCLVFRGIGPWSGSATSKYAVGETNNYSLDNSPGGISSTFADFQSDPWSFWYLLEWDIPIPIHSFIPTKSALAFTGTNADLGENVSSRNLVTTGETPFHSYWGPVNKNMPHISFDASMACWLRNEINGNPMPPSMNYIISGSSIICSTIATITLQSSSLPPPIELPVASTFTLQNFSSGTTVNWSRSSILTYVSGQGTASYKVKPVSSNSNSEGWVQASITESCGTVTLPRRNVWVGKPNPATNISFYPAVPCTNQQVYASAIVSNPVLANASYSWYNIGSYSPANGSQVWFETTGPLGYSTNVRVEVTNTCGSSEYSKLLTVVKCSGGGTPVATYALFASPNPSSSQITVSEVEPTNDNIPWVLRLMSGQGAVMVNVTATLPKTLNVSGLQPGVYILHARRGQYVEQQVIVVE
jgi:hypothetical protein